MIHAVIYETATGAIFRSVSLIKSSDLPLNVGTAESYILSDHEDSRRKYIDLTDPQNPVVADRPVWNPFPATGASPLTVDITDAPAGTSLTVADEGGDVTTVSDFTQPLTFVDAGGYTVNIAPPFPYQAITQKVTAT